MLAIFAASIPSFPLLLLALAMLGSGSAVNLQARFAATDLATPRHRGRDLSLVVWSTTIGAVLGPNLVGPGEALGASIHLPVLTGPLLFTIVAQFAAAAVYSIGLRPDPLLTRQVIAAQPSSSGPTAAQIASLADPRRAALAIVILALSHATMVAVMSMTPVHLSMEGASITIVGLVISLHIAGMYGLSPIFGILSDRMGRIPTVLVGQVLLAAAVITTALGGMNHTAVTIGLILLGLGWSASTVAGSALLTESVEPARRTIWQGRSDLSMNLAGALGGALAGPTLAIFGYSGLSVAAGLLVLVVLLAIAVVGLTRRARTAV
jgi:MFS family permease